MVVFEGFQSMDDQAILHPRFLSEYDTSNFKIIDKVAR